MEMKCLLTVFFPQIYLKIASALFISEGCWSRIATQVNVALCRPCHLVQSVRKKVTLTIW